MNRVRGLRALVFAAAAALHGALIFFTAFRVATVPQAATETAAVMKLADLAEERPPPPPPPSEPPPQSTAETIAEHFEETETPPVEIAAAPAAPVARAAEEEYLPMHLVSQGPEFEESAISRTVNYPPIALRSGIEGRVILELFIDRDGRVRRVVVLREEPPGRGFGEAAAKAFEGLRCVPARANGQNVSVRYRYPVTFRIR
ncbi:MAG: energy transducer TonB [Treponema sp.]|jgi:protein TonB|nr:energy transducer TonB [Treponema sp.]